MTRSTIVRGVVAAAVVAAFTLPASAAEQVLRAQVSLPQNNMYAVNWIKNYLPRVNAVGKGIIQIDFVGGSEVTPERKAALALKRGVFDMMHGPPAYYLGQVPEAYALTISTVTPAEARANGGYALLDDIWRRRLNAKVIAWGDSEIKYNLYFTARPKITKTGDIDLSGMKMRSTGTYRPIILGLGGTPVAMKSSEIYTGLQRGVVQGFGFPAVGIKPLGVIPVLKYKLEPSFYRLTNLILVNLNAWKKLSKESKGVIEKVGLEYERVSNEFMFNEQKKELADLAKYKIQTITLTDAAADRYLDKTIDPILKRLKKTVPDLLPRLIETLQTPDKAKRILSRLDKI